MRAVSIPDDGHSGILVAVFSAKTSLDSGAPKIAVQLIDPFENGVMQRVRFQFEAVRVRLSFRVDLNYQIPGKQVRSTYVYFEKLKLVQKLSID